LILVLPSLLGGGTDRDPIISRRDVEPLVIDVDSASWYEWALLDGIGEVRARRIVEYVREHRPITSLDELKTVPGLPTAWVERARPFLGLHSVETGKTTEPDGEQE
jgi:predicted DNA-binding helix-hairpin-helix protein